jgi:hypothetical protein
MGSLAQKVNGKSSTAQVLLVVAMTRVEHPIMVACFGFVRSAFIKVLIIRRDFLQVRFSLF